LTFIILKFENSLNVLPILLLFVTIAQVICFYVFLKIKYPEIKIKKKYMKFGTFKVVASYSVFVLLINLAGKLNYHTDAIVIGSTISVSMVVFFTIGNNFILYSQNLMSGISDVLIPLVSKIDALNDHSRLKILYLDYSKYASLLTMPLCLFFYIFGANFISIWMGSEYHVISGNILNILTLSSLFIFVQQAVAFPILMGISDVKFPSLLMLLTSILNLILSIWWGKKFGVYGVAWGTTIPNLGYSFILIWYVCKTLNFPLISYLFNGLLVPATSGIFFGLPLYILKNNFNVNSYIKVLIMISVSTILYFVAVFFIYLDKNTKELLLQKIKFCN
jgi:O-antigen/teichoic acid export membrane protein